MAYQITHKAAKAVLFHWMTNHWHIEALAKKQVSFTEVVDEMNMLDMNDLINDQPMLVYGTYKEVCEVSKTHLELCGVL